MNPLSPWTGVIDDTLLRLTNVAGVVGRYRAGLVRNYGGTLDQVAYDLTTADRDFVLPFEWRSEARADALGAVPPTGRFPPYSPSPAEQYLSTRRLVIDEELSNTLPSSANGVFIARDDDGLFYVYKPGDMEMYGGLNWIPHVPGQLARREVAGYRIFDALGAGARVPPTALVTGPHGPGMAQLFVPLKASKNWHEYPKVHQQQTAVGHFVLGNLDENEANIRPEYDGRNEEHDADDNMVVFDLGHSIPETADPRRGGEDFALGSPFVDRWAGEELEQNVLGPVSAATRDRLGSPLEDLELSDSSIDGVLDRLAYVQSTGTVAAEWPVR
ncbi:hypothetical protein HGA13_26015 [Nocardia speluncae]|uniref:Uncharacterized protein n=2 Tax=Nocardia speluncae TaxID=419477 RepID=A0A846XMP9_9NOCA|nr:hypothetical protein [Nocardia speluncae]NKY36499.1 hypothetical protein [Nocardia speluncae]